MPQIILKERATHLASYFYQEHLFHITDITKSNPGGNYVSCFCPMNTAKSLEEQLFYRIPAEVVTSRCSSKYVFLEVLQSSQESICTKVYF